MKKLIPLLLLLTAAFPLYDGMPLSDKPRDGIAGLNRAEVIYGWSFNDRGLWPASMGDEHTALGQLPESLKPYSLPPRDHVQRVIRSTPHGRLRVLDYEEIQTWQADKEKDIAAHRQEYRSAAIVVQWVRDADPYGRIFLYNSTPDDRNASAGTDDGRTEQNWKDWERDLMPRLDGFAESFYVGPDTDLTAWKKWVIGKCTRLKKYGKPHYGFFNARDCPPEKLQEAMDTLRDNCDGLILWCNPDKYESKAEKRWLTVVKG